MKELFEALKVQQGINELLFNEITELKTRLKTQETITEGHQTAILGLCDCVAPQK